MATQTLEFSAGTGLTLSCKLFALGSDTVVATQTATEKSNDINRYSVSFTNIPAGAYRLNAFVGATGGFANEVYDLTLTNDTFYPRSESAGTTAEEVADAVWDEELKGSTHNIPTSAGRRLRTLADTVVLTDGETVAADNAGSINGSNGLGRIRLQPDVGTVCRGQAVRVTGQVRYIEAYDADTQYATVDSGWCSIPEVGDEYTIFSQRTPLIQRINSADEGTIAYPIAKLWEMIEDSDGWRFSEKAVEEIQKTGDIDGYTLEEALKLILSVLAGKVSGGGTTEITFRAADDSKDRVVATITSAGNRTSITLDADG